MKMIKPILGNDEKNYTVADKEDDGALIESIDYVHPERV